MRQATARQEEVVSEACGGGQILDRSSGCLLPKMTFKGTRVPVETILYFLSTGRTIDQILEGWPYLKREAIQEAILMASKALIERYPLPTAELPRRPHEPTHS